MRADSLVYPHDELRPDGQRRQHFGLSVRDYIAIQAMQGFLSADRFAGSRADLAYNAYIIADAMIAESQREGDAAAQACGVDAARRSQAVGENADMFGANRAARQQAISENAGQFGASQTARQQAIEQHGGEHE
jgi:hypothetical protein